MWFARSFEAELSETKTFKLAKTPRGRPILGNCFDKAVCLKITDDPTSCLIKFDRNVKIRGLIETGSEVTLLIERIFNQEAGYLGFIINKNA
jgi:hypothetical protein